MRLCARKTTDMDVGEIIVIKPIIRPRLDVVTFVGAAVEERRHVQKPLAGLAKVAGDARRRRTEAIAGAFVVALGCILALLAMM